MKLPNARINWMISIYTFRYRSGCVQTNGCIASRDQGLSCVFATEAKAICVVHASSLQTGIPCFCRV
jgi:hypothetical protein